MTYLSGNRYEGNYKNDKKHGNGIYEWADGRKYIGEYVEDKREG